MRLDSFFIRFYKSFNINYQRRHAPNVKKLPWEIIQTEDGEMWFPFIKVPIDPKITAVVGANESGKSHLLTAIEKAVKGKDYKNRGISYKDFCRYSERFLITKNISRIPDFGSEWSNISEEVAEKIKRLSDIPQSRDFDHFFLFRSKIDQLDIYLQDGKEYTLHQVNIKDINEFQKILPGTRRLKNDIALPSSIPIQKLVSKIKGKSHGTTYEILSNDQKQNGVHPSLASLRVRVDR